MYYSKADVEKVVANALAELKASKSATRLNSGDGAAAQAAASDDDDDDVEGQGDEDEDDAAAATAATAPAETSTLADVIASVLEATPKHKSTKAAVAFLNELGMQHGYAVSIERSSGARLRVKTGITTCTSYIGCICRGKFASQARIGGAIKNRDTSSFKTECPFRFNAKECKWKDGDQKKRTCVLTAVCLEHNHPLALQAGVFSVHRQMARKDEAAEGIIASMVASHAKPSSFQATLTSHVVSRGGEMKWAPPTAKDVANWKQQASFAKAASGISDIEELVLVLQQNNWEVVSARDAALDCVAVVAVYRPARDLATSLKCSVYQWDATFCTNNKNWMFMDWTTTTPTYETMTLGGAFYLRKTAESYEYIVARLIDLAFLPESPAAQVLPGFVLDSVNVTDDETALFAAIATKLPDSKHLLDVWHVEKNILAYCRNGFTEETWSAFLQDWRDVQAAPKVELFQQGWAALHVKYADVKSGGKSVTAYLKKQWMSGHQHKFARCYTNAVLHLGNTTQQRVEGNHSYLKAFASGMSRNNTLAVCGEKLAAAVLHQCQRLCLSMDKVSARTPTKFRGVLYSDLVHRVHKWPLDKIAEQVALYNNREAMPLRPCTGEFTRTLGLPCLHILKEYIDAGARVPVTCLHSFWLIGSEKGSRPEPLKDAIKLAMKRKAEVARRPKQGTHGRIPSAFETVDFVAREEERAAKKAVPKVSKKAMAAAAAAQAALASVHAGGGMYLGGGELDSVFAVDDQQQQQQQHKKKKARTHSTITQSDEEEEEEEEGVASMDQYDGLWEGGDDW